MSAYLIQHYFVLTSAMTAPNNVFFKKCFFNTLNQIMVNLLLDKAYSYQNYQYIYEKQMNNDTLSL